MPRRLKAAVAGGLIAGTLDICYALVAYAAKGVAASTILKAIASGLLGQQAYSAGTGVVLFGAAIHFGLAILMAGIFVSAASARPELKRHPLTAGAAYGALLFLVMTCAIVPLSRAYPGTPPRGWLLLGSILAHVFLVGIPIALVTRWSLNEDRNNCR